MDKCARHGVPEKGITVCMSVSRGKACKVLLLLVLSSPKTCEKTTVCGKLKSSRPWVEFRRIVMGAGTSDRPTYDASLK